MTIHKLKSHLSSNLTNIPGWSTKRKLIVIESDDWGSVRMPSKEVFNTMLQKGIRVDKCPYNTNDTLASQQDLNVLFDLLSKIKDHKGNHPRFTFNTIVANPDFEKIRESGFKNYFYEPFTETLKKYYPNETVFKTWQEGIDNGLIWPQFHGREHLNVNRWLKALQANLKETRIAFDNNLFGISTTITSEKRKSYLPAFDFDRSEELQEHKIILSEGVALFETIFGFKPASFIAPNYTWNSNIENHLKTLGIDTIQGARAQQQPENGTINVKKHTMGERSTGNQIYLIRNVIFEPSLNKNVDWFGMVLREIKTAFLWGKPAVISSHRLNYIGSLNKANRDNTIKLLDLILKEVIKKWPEVEFITSDQLGKIIAETKDGNS